MKTLKSIVLGLALLVVTNVVKADEPTAAKITKNRAISTYISTMTEGNNLGFDAVLDENVKFSSLRGNKLVNFDKADMLKFIDQNKRKEHTYTDNRIKLSPFLPCSATTQRRRGGVSPLKHPKPGRDVTPYSRHTTPVGPIEDRTETAQGDTTQPKWLPNLDCLKTKVVLFCYLKRILSILASLCSSVFPASIDSQSPDFSSHPLSKFY